jgi:hypothetical protein
LRDIAKYEKCLMDYYRSVDTAGIITVQMGCRVELDLGSGVTVGGEVSRIDLLHREYRVWLFTEDTPVGWERELRMPLLQGHYADRLGVPPSEVGVGLYVFSSASYTHRVYPQVEILRALTLARQLATDLTA